MRKENEIPGVEKEGSEVEQQIEVEGEKLDLTAQVMRANSGRIEELQKQAPPKGWSTKTKEKLKSLGAYIADPEHIFAGFSSSLSGATLAGLMTTKVDASVGVCVGAAIGLLGAIGVERFANWSIKKAGEEFEKRLKSKKVNT